MAVLSMAKGLYHWAVVSGVAGPPDGFEYQPTPWQTATVFFAVIDLVAAVGLWLAAAWGRWSGSPPAYRWRRARGSSRRSMAGGRLFLGGGGGCCFGVLGAPFCWGAGR